MSGNRLRAASCVLMALAAAASAQEQAFTNEAGARGINYTIGPNFAQFGSGLGFVDLDSDGDVDLVLTGASTGKIALLENDGTGHFTDRSTGSGIPFSANVTAVSAGDYNGDGRPDLHFTRRPGSTDLLFRNNGSFHFTDVSAAAGINTDGAGQASCWGDYDGDGWLDLYVSYRTGDSLNFVDNKLFHNNHDGTFTDMAAALGVDVPGEPTLLATFFDFDNDGDADLYLGTDKGSSHDYMNHLFRNDGGTFTEITIESGTEAFVDCMGIAVADIDRNGFQDLFLTNLPLGHKLLLADGDGTFSDRTDDAGVALHRLGWSCFFFDYNNDGWHDLFITHSAAEDSLMRNAAAWPMVDVADAMNVDDAGASYCSAFADVDGDGDLDFAVATLLAPVRLYINHEGENRHWVRLNVVGVGANVHAIGAQARVTQLGQTQLGEIRAGCNYKSDNERTLHFGLGDSAAVCEAIRVRWPNSTTVRTLRNYLPDRTWTVWHPSRLGDADGNGSIDPYEIAEALTIMQANGGSPIQPGQEIYDINGDCTINIVDIIAMNTVISNPGGNGQSGPKPTPR